MSKEFFLGPSLASLLGRLMLITGLRFIWYAINGGTGSEFTHAIIPLPWIYLWGGSLVLASVDAVLAAYQWGLGFGIARQVVVRFWPARAVAWGLLGPGGHERKTASRMHGHSVAVTAFFLAGLVVLSCCLVGWILFAANSRSTHLPFAAYVSYAGQIPLMIGLGLSLAGWMMGGNYVARAAAAVGESFAITTLPRDHWLALRVKRIADELGLPTPTVATTTVTNAFAMGTRREDATVVIGTPLLGLDNDELDAIIGHELGHVLYNDVQRMQFAEGFQQALGKVISIVTVIVAVIAAQQSRSRSGARMNMELSYAFGNLFRRTVFIGSEMVVKGISRTREFHADAIGAQVTTADAMIRALERVHAVGSTPTPQERQYGYLMFQGGGLGFLFSTHPTLDARVRALKARAGFSDLVTAAHVKAGESALLPSVDMPGTPVEAGGASPPPSSLAAQFSPHASPLALRGAVRKALARRDWQRTGRWAIAAALAILAVPAITSFYEVDRHARTAGSALAELGSSAWTTLSTAGMFPIDLLKTTFGDDGQLQLLDAQLAEATQRLAQTRRELKAAESKASQLQSLVALGNRDRAALATENRQLLGNIKNLEDKVADLETRLFADPAAVAADDGADHEPVEESFSTPVVAPPERWASVAVSRRGHVIVVAGHANRVSAALASVSECKRFAPNAGCEAFDTFPSQCVAVARQHPGTLRQGWRTGAGGTELEAARRAMEMCTRAFGNCIPSAVTCN